ncbi:MAG: Bax inhibitor-1/YccA family protein [Gammaproteobacteria bacterium]|nr:Bax inhibitor-1/YccA family protein [Gammaproteobacteria bacterium]
MSDYGFRTDNQYATGVRSQDAILATNKVLKNTYLLLSMTLLFSACTAGIAMMMNLPQGAALILMLVSFGLLFWVHKSANSSTGLIAIFAFTGCLGASLGPMLNYYVTMISNGPMLIMQALGGTGLIFLTLSGYVLTTRKDFSFMRGFLFTGLIVAIIAMIANIFLQIPALSLAISSAVILIMSGLILFDTSRIIHGGETNYIRATVSLYLNIYNIFVHLLHLLAVLSGSRD